MKAIRWLAMCVSVMLLAACGGEDPNADLPPFYTIPPGGNLLMATRDLCGVEAAVQQGQGRWRKWRESDERIAKAPMRQDAKWGWVVTIPPGTYNVPQYLCADEAGFPWLAVLIFGGAIAAVAVIVALVRVSVRADLATDEDFGTSVRGR